tara:strand:+ start:1542 stop:1856 length:315 start_codon:yes stop_codon:yes gene_type:complete
MSGIKTLLGDGATGVDDFDLGENYGRYAMGRELLPLLRASRIEVKTLLWEWRRGNMHVSAPVSFNQIAATLGDLEAVIANIERAPLEAPTEPVGTLSAVNDVTF